MSVILSSILKRRPGLSISHLQSALYGYSLVGETIMEANLARAPGQTPVFLGQQFSPGDFHATLSAR
jgi:hypothetical protein